MFKKEERLIPTVITKKILKLPTSGYSDQRDCNMCLFISLTEKEKIITGNHKSHICIYYKHRVIHGADRRIHDPRLIPCKECMSDNYIHSLVCTEADRKAFYGYSWGHVV